jgi:thioredoxin 2
MTTSRQVVCAHCNAPVRIPVERIAETPRCPRCHEPLFTGEPIHLTAANFDQHVAQSDVPVVVDFWAPWCGPCRAMAPVFEQAARRVEPNARFAKLNTDDAQDIAARLGIRSIPTLMVFKQGKVVDQIVGNHSKEQIRRLLEKHVA